MAKKVTFGTTESGQEILVYGADHLREYGETGEPLIRRRPATRKEREKHEDYQCYGDCPRHGH